MRTAAVRSSAVRQPVVQCRPVPCKVARIPVPGLTAAATRVVCCHAATAPAADLEAPAAAAAAPAAAAQAPAPAEQQPQPVAASSSDAAPQPTATPAADTTTTTATSSSSSSSKKETGASNAIRVSKAAQPDKVASSILLQLRDAPEAPVILSSVGPEACAVAHKAIVLARALLRDSMPGQQLQYQPQRSRATIKEDAKENKEATSLVAYSYYVTASADTPLDTTPSSSSSSSSKGSDNPVIKISAKTKPYAAAIAITSRMRDHGAATLAAVGSAAIYATHQALSTSRLASIEEHGFDFQVVPALGAQEGLQGVVATFKLVKCAPRTTRRRRPSSRKPSRRPPAGDSAAAAAAAPGEVRLSQAEYDDMKAQLAALPAMTEQLALMTQQHKQLLALLAAQQQQQQQQPQQQQ